MRAVHGVEPGVHGVAAKLGLHVGRLVVSLAAHVQARDREVRARLLERFEPRGDLLPGGCHELLLRLCGENAHGVVGELVIKAVNADLHAAVLFIDIGLVLSGVGDAHGVERGGRVVIGVLAEVHRVIVRKRHELDAARGEDVRVVRRGEKHELLDGVVVFVREVALEIGDR